MVTRPFYSGTLYTLLFCFGLVSPCRSAAPEIPVLSVLPNLGDPIEIPKNSQGTLISAGQIDPEEKVLVAGLVFEIAAEKGRVVYIGTSDPKFRTSEGLAVGDTLQLLRSLHITEPRKEQGWAYYSKLASGWSAAFIVGSSTEGPLAPLSRIAYFFKRR